MLRRVLALVEVTLSNSKIEAFWRSLRHGWLYLNHLDTIGTLERLVRFYVEAHNATPHSSFRGPTPDELYHGKADKVVLDLAEAKNKAREARLAANRSSSCGACPRDAPARSLLHGASRRMCEPHDESEYEANVPAECPFVGLPRCLGASCVDPSVSEGRLRAPGGPAGRGGRASLKGHVCVSQLRSVRCRMS